MFPPDASENRTKHLCQVIRAAAHGKWAIAKIKVGIHAQPFEKYCPKHGEDQAACHPHNRNWGIDLNCDSGVEQNRNIKEYFIVSTTPSHPKSATQLLRDRARATPTDATLSEVFCDTATDGAPVGFTLAHLKDTSKPVLWIQDRLSRRETGRPYLAGLPAEIDLIYVDVSRPIDLLWAMEEGLRCADLGAVIGEIWGDPAALDFTATKRLALRSEAHRVPAWLIRRAASANLSAARLRWRINGLPSLNHPHDAQAPGQAQWNATLFRARWQTPGTWVAHHDADGLHFDHGLHGHTPQDRQAHG